MEVYFNKDARIRKFKYILIKLKDLRISLKNNLEQLGGFAAITRHRSKILSKRMFESHRFDPNDWSHQEYLIWLKLLETVERFYAIALIRQNRKTELIEFLRRLGREDKAEILTNDESVETVEMLYSTLLNYIRKDSDYFNYCRGFLYKESSEMRQQPKKMVNQDDLDNLKAIFLNHHKLFEAVTNDRSVWAQIKKH
ncbi:hypothetical protein C2G38_2170650 [Gigaspora rosea]|uniref:Uncharacterized protein n=1 Tax=Gigaspora rosea TaxID=44941 RepID=A0A397VMC7_9GLOM|nr:hypothetical protein C2G38_2170650 [Gigaspora rosea]